MVDKLAHEVLLKEIELWAAVFSPIFHIRQKELRSKCVDTFYRKMMSGKGLLEILRYMLHLNLYPQKKSDFRPTISEAVEILKKLMEQLQADMDGKRFAFAYQDTALHIYWNKEIAVFRELKFLKENSNHVRPDTKSMLRYDQFLPFNNANHEDDNCVTAADLPEFYKNKGKEPY